MLSYTGIYDFTRQGIAYSFLSCGLRHLALLIAGTPVLAGKTSDIYLNILRILNTTVLRQQGRNYILTGRKATETQLQLVLDIKPILLFGFCYLIQ